MSGHTTAIETLPYYQNGGLNRQDVQEALDVSVEAVRIISPESDAGETRESLAQDFERLDIGYDGRLFPRIHPANFTFDSLIVAVDTAKAEGVQAFNREHCSWHPKFTNFQAGFNPGHNRGMKGVLALLRPLGEQSQSTSPDQMLHGMGLPFDDDGRYNTPSHEYDDRFSPAPTLQELARHRIAKFNTVHPRYELSATNIVDALTLILMDRIRGIQPADSITRFAFGKPFSNLVDPSLTRDEMGGSTGYIGAISTWQTGIILTGFTGNGRWDLGIGFSVQAKDDSAPLVNL